MNADEFRARWHANGHHFDGSTGKRVLARYGITDTSNILLADIGPDGYYTRKPAPSGKGFILETKEDGVKQYARIGPFPWPTGCWGELVLILNGVAA